MGILAHQVRKSKKKGTLILAPQKSSTPHTKKRKKITFSSFKIILFTLSNYLGWISVGLRIIVWVRVRVRVKVRLKVDIMD